MIYIYIYIYIYIKNYQPIANFEINYQIKIIKLC